jgi:hypothetical protein
MIILNIFIYNMEIDCGSSFLTPDERKRLIVETVTHLDTFWLEWLQPLMAMSFQNNITGKVTEVDPCDYELFVEWGEFPSDTLSVRRAVLINLEEMFNWKHNQKTGAKEVQEIAHQVVCAINEQIRSDPREPDTDRLKDSLLDQYIENDDKQTYIAEESIPLKIGTYFKSDEKSRWYVFGEIDNILWENDALEKRNQFIRSHWILPIEDWEDTSGFKQEEDWLDRDDIDGEVKFYGPNKSWQKEQEGQVYEEKRPLPLSTSENYFLDILPDYLIWNAYLLPQVYVWEPFDPNAHGEVLSKMLLRKTLIAIYAENNPKKGKGSKKLQTQYGDHLDALLQEIENIKYRLERGE